MPKKASFRDLETSFKKKKFEPIYFFFGREDFLIEELITSLKQYAFTSEMDMEMNFTLLYGQEVSVSEIVSASSAYPMFSERKVVVVRSFDKVRKERTKEKLLAQMDELTRYVNNPLESTVLVLCAGELDKKDLAKEPYTLLDSVAYEFSAVRDIAAFADDYAKRMGWRFTPEALNLYVLYVGGSLRDISNEFQKLALYAGERAEKIITEKDVTDVVGISKEYNVFELQKAIGSRDLRKASGIALMIMLHEDKQREELMSILNALTVFFMRLWKLKLPMVSRMSKFDMERELGMFGGQAYFLNEYQSYADSFSLNQIEHAIAALHETDLCLKGIKPFADEQAIMLKLIQSLLN